MKNLIRVILIGTCILAVSGVSGAMGQFLFFGNPLEGRAAPEFTLRTVGGSTLDFSQFRQGRPAIIFFWATWCPHCRDQLRELNASRAQLEGQGIRIALVDIEEGRGIVREYLDRHQIGYDVFLDETGDVAQRYAILGVPTYFLVDAQGIIRAAEHALPEDYMEILAGQAD